MRVEEITSEQRSEWDQFHEKFNRAGIFYQFAWQQLVSAVCRYTPVYLVARRSEAISGILPLFHVASGISGQRLISLPYAGNGGILAEDDASAAALLDYAVTLSDNLNLDYLELRGGFLADRRLALQDHYYTFILDLSPGPDELLKNCRKSMRKTIRKSLGNNLRLEYASCEDELKAFYRLHAIDMKRFGTPVQSFTWLRELTRTFPESHKIAKVIHGNKIIAMFLMRTYRSTVTEILGNDLPAYRHLYPNIFLQWKMIEDACEKHHAWYDFGRSIQESSTYFFKQGWNATPVPLRYGYYLRNRKSIPDTSQSNGRRQVFAKIWKHLPLPVTTWTGPKIRRLYP